MSPHSGQCIFVLDKASSQENPLTVSHSRSSSTLRPRRVSRGMPGASTTSLKNTAEFSPFFIQELIKLNDWNIATNWVQVPLGFMSWHLYALRILQYFKVNQVRFESLRSWHLSIIYIKNTLHLLKKKHVAGFFVEHLFMAVVHQFISTHLDIILRPNRSQGTHGAPWESFQE